MVIAYLRERFRPRTFGGLALAIAAAAAVRPVSWTTYAFDCGFALLLLAQFRLWDDLADRGRDRVVHPGRVLVRAANVTQLVAFCGALAVFNICLSVWRDASGIAVGVLASLNAVLAVWYLARTGRTIAGEHLLLAKYPAMILIVSGARVLDRADANSVSRGRPVCPGVRLRGVARPRRSPRTPCRRSLMSVATLERTSDAPPAARVAPLAAPPPWMFERVPCYLCGSTDFHDYITAQDDLGGTPGHFQFVRCTRCGLVYQNPRLSLEHIGAYYDDTYIAHRKKRNWGVLTPLFERAMNKLDADEGPHRLPLCLARIVEPRSSMLAAR